MQTVKLRQWIGGRKTKATVENERDGGKRNENVTVSSILSPSEQAGVMSTMRNEICFSLSNCPVFSDDK